MSKSIPVAAAAMLAFLTFTAIPASAYPLLSPSIPGLESSITRKINFGVARGILSPMQANNLRGRLSGIEAREQFLINSGQFNRFQRARIAADLENLNASVNIDRRLGKLAHPRFFGFFRY